MKLFQSKQKVHLSPRLARSLGRSHHRQVSPVAKTLGICLIFFALLGVRAILSQDGNGLQSSAQALSQDEAGKVLGAQDQGVAYYQIRSGDTLLSISQKFGVYWMSIVEENELTPPYALTPDQTLRIPLPGGN